MSPSTALAWWGCVRKAPMQKCHLPPEPQSPPPWGPQVTRHHNTRVTDTGLPVGVHKDPGTLSGHTTAFLLLVRHWWSRRRGVRVVSAAMGGGMAAQDSESVVTLTSCGRWREWCQRHTVRGMTLKVGGASPVKGAQVRY